MLIHVRFTTKSDDVKPVRALLKLALRRLGLRAIEIFEEATQQEADMATPYKEKIEKQKQTGLYKVADFENRKEVTHVIDRLLEDVELFDRKMDILNFQDTGRQLQMNIVNAETLMTLFGDDPSTWAGHEVTLYLDEYKIGKFGIRIKAPTKSANGPTPPAVTSRRPPLDDEIPF